MPIPFFKSKYESDPSVKPSDMFYLMNDVSSLKDLPKAPENCILSPLTKVLDISKSKLDFKEGPSIMKPIYLYDNLALYSDFVGFGAPMWTWIFEQLIFWGIKNFIFIGYIGKLSENLDNDQVYYVEKALKDEGVSHHYEKAESEWAYPEKNLTEKLSKQKASPISVWTTDVMFRETHSEIEYAIKNNIAGFEMECSALFTVAKIKQIKMASLQVVSDYYLNKEFKPVAEEIKWKNLEKAINICLNVFDIK